MVQVTAVLAFTSALGFR